MKPRHIVASMLVAVFGLAAVFVAQPSLGQTTQPDPAPVAAPQVQTKTIVVAVRPLRFGTEIKKEHLREVSWAETAIPSGSFESISDLLSVEGRRAVLSPVEPNQPVLSWKITGPGERATLSARVDEGMRAMSIPINNVYGVKGLVLPGYHFEILLTRNGYTELLLQNIKVLAIDHPAAQPKSGKTATVEVNSIDAHKLALAQTAGTLSLVLRAPGTEVLWAIKMRDLGPAYEVYTEAREGEGEEETTVDLLDKNMEETFQAIENRIGQMGQEFRGTQTLPFVPSGQFGYPFLVKCAAVTPRHPFAGRHPCFPE
jgi:pilus assembly protein CpaB